MRKVLPIIIDTCTKVYNSTAFPLSILECKKSHFGSFIINRYIQVVYDRNDNGFLNYYEDKPYYFWNCFYTKSKRKIHFRKNNLQDYIESQIDKGFYIVSYFNEYYIPQRLSFEKYNFLHDNMIYGYDNTHFYVLGYDNKRFYSSIKVSKEKICKSFFSYERASDDRDLSNFIFCIKPKDSFEENIQIASIKNSIQNYLNCIDPQENLNVEVYANSIFGLNAFLHFFEEIKKKNYVDFRFLRLFFEHKSLMKERITKLSQLIFIDKSIIESYSYIEEEAHIIYFKFIQTSLIGNGEKMAHCCDEAQKICLKEVEILRKLVSYL